MGAAFTPAVQSSTPSECLVVSYALGEEVFKRKVTMLGTMRKNKPELSSELLAVKNRKVTSSVFVFTEQATLVSYCPKKGKNVLLLSTMHKAQRETKHNETKGGVGNLEKVTATYSSLVKPHIERGCLLRATTAATDKDKQPNFTNGTNYGQKK